VLSLSVVLFAEGVVALFMMVKVGPLRELAMRVVDQVKTGKGPSTVKTLACTLSVILMSNVASILKIQNRGLKLGTVSPMDQVLWTRRHPSLVSTGLPSQSPSWLFFTDSIMPAA
jgi:B-cell receptor-associated protein 31